MTETTQDISRILSDPEFLSLAPAERSKVLDAVDSDFKGLPEKEKIRVVMSLSKPEDVSRPGFWGRLGEAINPMPILNMAGNAISAGVNEPSPTGNPFVKLGAALNASVVPMAKGMANQSLDAYRKSKEAEAQGNIGESAYWAMSSVPFAGPVLQQVMDDIGAGNYAGAAGTVVGLVAPQYIGSKIIQSAPAIKRSAQRTYSQAIQPTKEFLKIKAEKRVPELLDRHVVASSLYKLDQSIKDRLRTAITDLNNTINALPPDRQVPVQFLRDQISDDLIKTFAKGSMEVANKPRFDALIDELYFVNKLGRQTDKVSVETLIDLRRKWDDMTTAPSGKYKSRQELKGSADYTVRRSLADAIRRQLNSQFPNLANANAEYSFWKDSADLVKATINRRTGQYPLVRRLATIAGAGVGASTGGFGAAIGNATVGYLTGRLLDSPGFKMLSSDYINSLANVLAGPNAKLAVRVITPALQAQGIGIQKQQVEPE